MFARNEPHRRLLVVAERTAVLPYFLLPQLAEEYVPGQHHLLLGPQAAVLVERGIGRLGGIPEGLGAEIEAALLE